MFRSRRHDYFYNSLNSVGIQPVLLMPVICVHVTIPAALNVSVHRWVIINCGINMLHHLRAVEEEVETAADSNLPTQGQ